MQWTNCANPVIKGLLLVGVAYALIPTNDRPASTVGPHICPKIVEPLFVTVLIPLEPKVRASLLVGEGLIDGPEETSQLLTIISQYFRSGFPSIPSSRNAVSKSLNYSDGQVFWFMLGQPNEEPINGTCVGLIKSSADMTSTSVVSSGKPHQYYIGLAGLFGPELFIQVYAFDVIEIPASKYKSLDGKLASEWPDKMNPIASIKTKLRFSTGHVSKLLMTRENSDGDAELLIAGSISRGEHGDAVQCGQFQYRYSLEKQLWSGERPSQSASN